MAIPTARYPDERMYLDITPCLTLLGQLFVKWDSYWYLNIVEYGYQLTGPNVALSNLAFAPLYPLAMYVTTQLGMEAWVGGVLVSLVCYLWLLYYLFQLGCTMSSPKLGVLLMVFVSAFPSAWVLHMVYSDGMFCLVLAAFLTHYLRGEYVRAGLWGFFLPLVRIAGLALLPAIAADLACRYWKDKRLSRSWISLLLAILGLCSLGVFYTVVAGDPLAFAAGGKTWFEPLGVGGHQFPLLTNFVRFISTSPDTAMALLFFIIYVCSCGAMLKKERNICSWFGLFYMLMLFKTPLPSAQMRYLLPLFAVHAYLIGRLLDSKLLKVGIVVLILTQLVLTHMNLAWRIII
ncbi:MAG: hypothetical protein IIB19_04580 [Chloroflexi bacterium]|nr:hypothetical protein [Chloroflexota bacterium]